MLRPASSASSASSEPGAPASAAAAPGSGDPLVAGRRWVRYPPGVANVLLPVGERAAGAAGVCLYPASRRVGRVGQAATWWAVRLAGAGVLPAPRRAWTPPLPGEAWLRLRAELDGALGPADAFAVYERPQSSRAGFGLMLLAAGEQLAFVKVRADDGRLRHERDVLARLEEAPLGGLGVPRLRASGGADGWGWVAMDPMPARPHRPVRRLEHERLAPALARALRAAVGPPPPGTPAHWLPMHGDLTPWNVRRGSDGRLWVLDWEDAGWGPPGADAAYYRAVAAVVHREAPGRTTPEVAAFWRGVVSARSLGDADARLNRRLDAVLRRMAPPVHDLHT